MSVLVMALLQSSSKTQILHQIILICFNFVDIHDEKDVGHNFERRKLLLVPSIGLIGIAFLNTLNEAAIASEFADSKYFTSFVNLSPALVDTHDDEVHVFRNFFWFPYTDL